MNLKIHLAIALLGIGVAFGPITARADVVAVVSAKNPVAALSKSQVIDIFLGKIDRFPDGSPAIPIDQQEGSPARDEFYATFAGISAAQLRSHWAKIIFTGRGQPPRTVATLAELRKLLAANPQAIAYVERSAVDDSMKVVVRP
jgi:ABC-type phosphate transport system substrate-binding protein